MKLKSLSIAQTHSALLNRLGQSALLKARTPLDWPNNYWEDLRLDEPFSVCVDAVFAQRGKPSPVFKLRPFDSDLVFALFRGNAPPPGFDLPIKNAATQWVVGVFRMSGEFAGGLFVGSFSDALAHWCKPNQRKLDLAFAEYIAALDPKTLTNLKADLHAQMIEELDSLEREYEARVAATRGRYRNRLNYFTTLHDDAQDRLDKKDKATYTIELDGYPPSREYNSYKEARRAHSKRNVPHIPAVINRHRKKAKPEAFALWSIHDRIWNIL